MNMFLLTGHVVGQVDVRQSGAKFLGRLMLRPEYKSKNAPDPVPVTCFRRTRDQLDALKEGDLIVVIGRVQQDNWTARDGTQRTKTVLVASHMRTLKHSVPLVNDEPQT